METVFAKLPAFHSGDGNLDRLLQNGNPFRKEHCPAGKEPPETSLFRVYDSAGAFIGVYEYSEDKKLYSPRKIFLGGN